MAFGLYATVATKSHHDCLPNFTSQNSLLTNCQSTGFYVQNKSGVPFSFFWQGRISILVCFSLPSTKLRSSFWHLRSPQCLLISSLSSCIHLFILLFKLSRCLANNLVSRKMQDRRCREICIIINLMSAIEVRVVGQILSVMCWSTQLAMDLVNYGFPQLQIQNSEVFLA